MAPEPPALGYSVDADGFSFAVLEPPLPPAVIDDLMALWAHPDVFGACPGRSGCCHWQSIPLVADTRLAVLCGDRSRPR